MPAPLGFVLHPPAKVNLVLEVLGRRDDGFHEIRSIIQTIALTDTLVVEEAPALELLAPDVPGPLSENLVWRAAHALASHARRIPTGRLTLTKAIPIAGGLGGGSSDAAATLVGLDRLWGTRLATDELKTIAGGLGSDVPFFIEGGTALVEGRGEIVVALPDAPAAWLVVAAPHLTVEGKTRRAYAAVRSFMHSQGELAEAMMARIIAGEPGVHELLGNTFDVVAPGIYPGFDEIRLALFRCGMPRPHVAGAGPALYALAASSDEARRMADCAAATGLRAHAVATLARADALAIEAR